MDLDKRHEKNYVKKSVIQLTPYLQKSTWGLNIYTYVIIHF